MESWDLVIVDHLIQKHRGVAGSIFAWLWYAEKFRTSTQLAKLLKSQKISIGMIKQKSISELESDPLVLGCVMDDYILYQMIPEKQVGFSSSARGRVYANRLISAIKKCRTIEDFVQIQDRRTLFSKKMKYGMNLAYSLWENRNMSLTFTDKHFESGLVAVHDDKYKTLSVKDLAKLRPIYEKEWHNMTAPSTYGAQDFLEDLISERGATSGPHKMSEKFTLAQLVQIREEFERDWLSAKGSMEWGRFFAWHHTSEDDFKMLKLPEK